MLKYPHQLDIQKELDFPDAWWELYDNGNWPTTMDYLEADNISTKAGIFAPEVRDPHNWMWIWYGMGTVEVELAGMVLRDILDYNPYQHWYKSMNLILWWSINAGATTEEQAMALNEMNYRLGYTEYYMREIGDGDTDIPF